MSSVKQIQDRIVVGADASTASRHAVLWAVTEARLRHGDLIITHIQPAVPAVGSTQDEADLDRHLMLAAMASAASIRQPGVAVGTLLIRGDISDQLIELSRSSAVLVVGLDRAMPRAAHGATGPLEDRVVAHAWCPVVIVSERPPVNDAPYHRVVVGLTAGADAHDVLNAAADEAVVRQAALRVVIGQANESTGVEPLAGLQGAALDLQHVIDALGRTHPQLSVTSCDAAGRLPGVLECESSVADLMVVGCAQSEDRWSIRTGALSSEMTRKSHCPVMLIGQRVTHRTPVSSPAV